MLIMENTRFIIEILYQASLGISLSACAGLRAFLPILVLGIFTRLGYVHVSQDFAWIGSTPSLIVFGVATVAEILGDKFPAVDHFLDSIGLVVKPAAGTLIFSTVILKMDPLLALVLGLIVGGSISELIHLKKAGLRVASSSLTLGLANPVVSILEDLGTAMGSLLSVLAPFIAIFLVVLSIYFSFRFWRDFIARWPGKELDQERRKMSLVMECDKQVALESPPPPPIAEEQ
jgi:hypothetical protein